MTVLRHGCVDAVRRGRPWSLPLEDRALLVAAYWRTNLTMRQLAPLFGVSKSAVDRIHGLQPDPRTRRNPLIPPETASLKRSLSARSSPGTIRILVVPSTPPRTLPLTGLTR